MDCWFQILRREILDVLNVSIVYRLLIPDFQGGILDVLNVSFDYGLLIQDFKGGKLDVLKVTIVYELLKQNWAEMEKVVKGLQKFLLIA